MSRTTIIALLTIATGGSVARAHPESVDPHTCVCEKAKVENGWCGMHKRGYIAGLLIPSAMLFEEIDPHGHEIDVSAISCASCRAAQPASGYCSKCNIGFVGNRAYMSKLTWLLAKAEPIRREAVSCPTCRSNTERYGWCDKCHVGFVGSFRFLDRNMFDDAVKAYGVIEAAVRKLPQCKVCAAAIVGNGYCPKCRIHYKDGKPVEAPTPDAPSDDAKQRPPQDDDAGR